MNPSESTDLSFESIDDINAWLADIDAKIVEVERAKEEALKLEQARSLERHRLACQGIELMRVRRDKASILGNAAILAQLDSAIASLTSEMRLAVEKLGYDPRERELQAQREVEQQEARASQDKMSRLLQNLGGPANPLKCSSVLKELLEGEHKLRFEDAFKVYRALAQSYSQLDTVMPEEVRSFLQEFEPIESKPEAQTQFAKRLDDRRSHLRQFGAIQKELSDIHQAAISLETSSAQMQPRAIWLRIQELCCRAKLLQHDHSTLINEEQDQLLRTEIFGRLRGIHKQHRCAFLNGLDKNWYPVDMKAEIQNCQRQFDELSKNEPATTVLIPQAGKPENDLPQPLNPRTAKRLQDAEHWVLAEVYRHVNTFLRSPDDVDVTQRLRQCVSHAIDFLETEKEKLPNVVRQCAHAFAEGSEFRWLRKRFARLDEDAIAPTNEEEILQSLQTGLDDEAPAEIEALTGKLTHPSVLQARKYTTGKRILLVGGTPDEQRRQKLELLLDAQVAWVRHERNDGPAQIQRAAEQVSSGSHDIVVYFLGFLSHKATGIVDESAQSRNVLIARVRRGVGPVGVSEAILACMNRLVG